MLSLANVFRVLTELVFILLGMLVVWVTVTSRYSFNRRSPAWIALGAFLVYWGLRAWWRRGGGAQRGEAAAAAVRGASLALVGAMMLGIACVPLGWTAPLLGAAGVILMVRGLLSTVLFARIS